MPVEEYLAFISCAVCYDRVIMEPASQDPTIERLEDQIQWYDRKSGSSQKAYKRLKICTIVAAALVPALAGTAGLHSITAGLGVFIVLVEGLQQLYQFQSNWIAYRSTCEALKHEKYLYLGKAGPYGAGDPHALLAERIESLVSQEHAKWASSREQSAKGPEKG
jgi:hypothetical protein